jgi:putative membrane protein
VAHYGSDLWVAPVFARRPVSYVRSETTFADREDIMAGAKLILSAGDWSMHGDLGFGWWLVMTIGMVAFWAAVIALAVWLVRSRPERRETPEEVLDRRLAAGELDVEEYGRRKHVLGPTS